MLGCIYCTWILCYTTCCAMTFSLIPLKNRNNFLSAHSPSFTHHPWLKGFTKRTGNNAQNSTRRNWMLLSSGMWHRAVYGRSAPTFQSLLLPSTGMHQVLRKMSVLFYQTAAEASCSKVIFIVAQWEPEISTRKLVEAATHLTRIREVSNSNLGWDTAYPDRVFLNLSRDAGIIH